MTIQDKMHQGALYQPMNADLQKEQLAAIDQLAIYNQIPASHQAERFAQLKKCSLKLALKVILRHRFIQTLVGRMFILAVVSMLILI